MTAHSKISGVWKEVDSIHCKVSGAWKDVSEGYAKVSGVWEQFYSKIDGIIATGGDLIYDVSIGGVLNRVHEFNSVGSATFSVTDLGVLGNEVTYLVVAGGGGGGNDNFGGGGGGAGGYLTGLLTVSVQDYSVTVGDGGLGCSTTQDSLNGENSIFNSFIATGGGRGGGDSAGGSRNGGNGGSGGGEAGNNTSSISPGTGVSGQGFRGGFGSNPNTGAGGGGGASQVGQDGSGDIGGVGGVGVTSTITGSSVEYSRGGAGGGFDILANPVPVDLMYGRGGYGQRANIGFPGRGTQGIVLIRYPLEAA